MLQAIYDIARKNLTINRPTYTNLNRLGFFPCFDEYIYLLEISASYFFLTHIHSNEKQLSWAQLEHTGWLPRSSHRSRPLSDLTGRSMSTSTSSKQTLSPIQGVKRILKLGSIWSSQHMFQNPLSTGYLRTSVFSWEGLSRGGSPKQHHFDISNDTFLIGTCCWRDHSGLLPARQSDGEVQSKKWYEHTLYSYPFEENQSAHILI